MWKGSVEVIGAHIKISQRLTRSLERRWELIIDEIHIEINLLGCIQGNENVIRQISFQIEVLQYQVGDDGVILRTRESIPWRRYTRVILHAIEPDTAHVPVRFANIICPIGTIQWIIELPQSIQLSAKKGINGIDVTWQKEKGKKDK